MNPLDYKSFYDKIGALNGWDFSRLHVTSEGALWDFHTEVARRCKKSDFLLDIGTGGGERLLALRDAVTLLVGIDSSTGMIETARANLLKAKAPHIRFLEMEAEHLAFPARFFNVVASRHAPFHAHEVARVLTEDGVFLTQQVSANDKGNLKLAFGRGQHDDRTGRSMRDEYRTALTEAGFTDIQLSSYDATEYYGSYEDLVFLLKHTPIIPGFGEDEADFGILHRFVTDNQTEQGIRTNAERLLVVARRG